MPDRPRVKVTKSDVVIHCEPDTSIDDHDWKKVEAAIRENVKINGCMFAPDFVVEPFVYGLTRLTVVCQIIDSQVPSTEVICKELQKIDGVADAKMVSIETASVDWAKERKKKEKEEEKKDDSAGKKKKKKKKKKKEKVRVIDDDMIKKAATRIIVATKEAEFYVVGIQEVDGLGSTNVTKEHMVKVLDIVREKVPNCILMLTAAGSSIVSVLASVPESKKDQITAVDWANATAVDADGDDTLAYGEFKCDPEKDEFPMKVKDQCSAMAFGFLRTKKLIVEDSDSDDGVFLDDIESDED